jgi:hypothetical protein
VAAHGQRAVRVDGDRRDRQPPKRARAARAELLMGEARGDDVALGHRLVQPLEGLGDAELALALACAGDVRGRDRTGLAQPRARIVRPWHGLGDEERERSDLFGARRRTRHGVVVGLEAREQIVDVARPRDAGLSRGRQASGMGSM